MVVIRLGHDPNSRIWHINTDGRVIYDCYLPSKQQQAELRPSKFGDVFRSGQMPGTLKSGRSCHDRHLLRPFLPCPVAKESYLVVERATASTRDITVSGACVHLSNLPYFSPCLVCLGLGTNLSSLTHFFSCIAAGPSKKVANQKKITTMSPGSYYS